MDIDLRKEIHDLIEETGHYVLLQRTSRKLRCICWDEKTQESSVSRYIERSGDKQYSRTSCPRCLGEGWVSRIEKVKTRRQMASNIISLPGKNQQALYGRVSIDTRLFFFEHFVSPKNGDYIYEVGWHKGKPTHIIEAFEIASADDMRGDRGRIEFWQATMKEDTINIEARGFAIKKIGPIKNYELLR